MSHENCDECQTDYDFTPANCTIYLFLDDPKANFIEAKCPNGHAERIFSTTAGIVRVATGGFPIVLALKPTGEIKKAAEAAWKAAAPVITPDPVPKPPERKAIMPKPKELPIYDITPSLARMLARFIKTVEAMPDDLLYDELTMEHPSDLPANWRGADTRPGDHDGKSPA